MQSTKIIHIVTKKKRKKRKSFIQFSYNLWHAKLLLDLHYFLHGLRIDIIIIIIISLLDKFQEKKKKKKKKQRCIIY